MRELATRRKVTARLVAVGVSIVTIGGVLLAVWMLFPPGRGLVVLCLYTVLTNTYISVLPFEPFFFFYASQYDPYLVTLAAGVGALVSGLLDYSTLNPVLRFDRIRSFYADRRLYKWAIRMYDKAPFALIVFAALTPFPYYPVKFFALSSRYPMSRYLAALMVGRLPRFFILAVVGHAIDVPVWLLALTFVAMVGVTVFSALRGKSRR